MSIQRKISIIVLAGVHTLVQKERKASKKTAFFVNHRIF